MRSDKKLSKADGFIKKRKQLKLWHKLLMITGSLVVFITTYMLILPAITAEVGTLAIFEENIASGSSLTESGNLGNGTIIDEEETQTQESSSGSSGGSGGSGSKSDDGVKLEIELEEIKDDKDNKEEKADELESEGFFDKIVSAAADVVDAIITTSGTNDDGSYVCKYDEKTGKFELNMNINFNIPQSLLDNNYNKDIITPANDYSRAYTIHFPKDVIVPDSLLYNQDGVSTAVYPGMISGTTEKVFSYYFVKNADGTYDLVMAFLDEYLDEKLVVNGERQNIDGTVNLKAKIDVSAFQEDGSIKVQDEEKKFEINIDSNDIEYGKETIDKDIAVVKGGSYNSGDKTLTYTIKVLTRKGTGETITIDDSFVDPNLLASLGAKFDGISCKQGVVGYYDDEHIDESNTTFTTISAENINYSYDVNTGKMSITLPGLEGVEGDYGYQPGYKNNNCYIITYKYEISPEAAKKYSAGNKVNVKTHDDKANTDVTDESSVTVNVSGKELITKTNSVSDQVISWKITIGDGDTNLNKYTVYDETFGILTENDIKSSIKHSDGSVAPESEYEIIKDESTGKIKGIKFKEGAAKNYTIEYKQTTSESWLDQSISNTAELKPDDDSGSHSSTSSVTIKGGSDCFNKTFVSAEENADNSDLHTVTWNVKFTVPSTGIPADMVFTDFLGGTGHYITYAQAQEIVTNLKAAWGENNIKNIQFYTGTDANLWDHHTDETKWVNADSLTEGSNYYCVRYTTANKIDKLKDGESSEGKITVANNIISYNYPTTIDTSNAGDSAAYNNRFTDGNINRDAWWNYSKKVIKYGVDSNGNLSSQNSNVTTKDGIVSWVVKVNLDKDITNYTITDNLPSNVTLNKLYISKEEKNNYKEVNINNGASTTPLDNVNLEVTYNSGAEGSNSAILNANFADTAALANLSNLYIKYECKINGDTPQDGNPLDYDLKNSVNVTVDGNKEYGSDDQTTHVTWKDDTTSEKDLTKEDVFNDNTKDNILHYSLDINPNGEMYKVGDEEFSRIELEDVLTYYSYKKSGIVRDASLISNSLKLYYAETDENGKGIIGSDGKLVNSNRELEEDAYSWSFEKKETEADWGETIVKTLKLKIPNGVPIIFKYDYLVTIIFDETATPNPTDYLANVSNSAIITINGHEVSDPVSTETKKKYEQSDTEGVVKAAAGYIIHKVDKDNYAFKLPGATFDFYVFEGTGFKKVSSYTTSNDGTIKIEGTPVSNETTKEVYAYKVKGSDGSEYEIPVDTICYVEESSAPTGYRIDKTKRYFYFGKNYATMASSCNGFSQAPDSGVENARNVILSHNEYIPNEHSSDYYAEKTNFSVVKKWYDVNGNDITKSKNDGSIKFRLYRVFTDILGNIKEDPKGSGSSSGGGSGSEGGGTIVDPRVTLNWETSGSGGVISDNRCSGSKKCEKNSIATISVKCKNVGQWWYPAVTVKDADTGEVLVNNEQTGDPNVNNTRNPKWDMDTQTFTFQVEMGESDRNIKISCGDNNDTISVTVDTPGGSGETEQSTEAPTEATSSEVTTILHEHNFSDRENNIIVDTGKDENGKQTYSYTINDDYFNIVGDLSTDHGKATYEIGGQGTELDQCLKMETKTSITFTTGANKGVLTLVFNESGNGTTDVEKGINNGCKINGHKHTASNNVLKMELAANTEYTISKDGTCYLFYMSFSEGATIAGSNIYNHNFNNGKESLFYTIASTGSTATNKGTISFNDTTVGQCLKMNSKAKITFNAPADGTINLLLTNPNGDAVVGAKVNGEDHHAAEVPGLYCIKDGNQYPVYMMTCRVPAGDNLITRINGTESMLFFINYTPDDFGSGEESATAPENPYATDLGEFEISAANEWSKVFADYPWEVVDDETMELKGHYSYYVVETTTGYTTKYINNKQEGISSGTIGIHNIDESNNTDIEVQKRWFDVNGNPNDADHALTNEEITFDLYSTINLLDGQILNTSRTESHIFTSYNSDFYTISTTKDDNGVMKGPYINTEQYGTAKYNGTTYSSCLKMESATDIKFNAPAKGKLTLVFSNKIPDASYGGLGFSLVNKGNTYTYGYDASTGETTGDCTVDYSNDAVIFTVDLPEAGEYEIKTAPSKQCYLFYMDYNYKLSDAQKGTKVGTYTINAKNYWTTNVSNLPLDIKDKDGNVIGKYSYYVVEISPNSGYKTTYSYDEMGEIPGGLLITENTITNGMIIISNQTVETNVTLPEAGGSGTSKYILAGLSICVIASLLLYKRRNNFLR